MSKNRRVPESQLTFLYRLCHAVLELSSRLCGFARNVLAKTQRRKNQILLSRNRKSDLLRLCGSARNTLAKTQRRKS